MTCRLLRISLVCLVLCQPAPGLSLPAPCAAPQAATDPKFAPGQVWAYRSNPGEEGATITILRVQTLGKVGTLVHVRLGGVHFNNCQGQTLADNLPHAPFARAALEESVTKQIGRVAVLPDFEEGYRDWLQHCGGVYTLPVARMVALVEAQYRAGLGVAEESC